MDSEDTTASQIRRRAEAEEMKAELLGLHRPTLTVAHPQHGNERRQGLSGLESFILSLLISGGALATYHYMARSAPVESAAPKAIPVELNTHPELIRLKNELIAAQDGNRALSAQLTGTERHIESMQSQLGVTQKQFNDALSQLAAPKSKESAPALTEQVQAMALHLAAIQTQYGGLESRLKSMDTQLTEMLTREKLGSAGQSIKADAASVPGEQLEAGEITRQLVIMKERNRATLLADEAISTGKAGPVRLLWEFVRDPEREVVKHGVTAELIRVQNHFMSFTRLPPTYRLSLADGKALKDVDLPEAAIIQVLEDPKSSFLDRSRAAQLLGKHKTLSSARALVACMSRDEEIDVVKEAQLALRATFGMTAPIFDADFASTWLKREEPHLAP